MLFEETQLTTTSNDVYTVQQSDTCSLPYNPFSYHPDYEHIYAQALYLAQHEAEMLVMSQKDIRQLDQHNEQYVSQSVEVELCSVYVHHSTTKYYMKLTLEQTRIIKGIAILMMVFLHLFNHIEEVERCTYFLTIGNVPLVHWLTRAANPVPFYLFISGYGLYYSWSSGKELKPWSRCLKLYQVYWVSLLVMVGLGYFIKSSVYPGSIIKVIENTIGWNTSYNAEAWFLFPYLLLVLTAKWLFSWVSKMRGAIIAGGSFSLYLAAAFIIYRASRSGDDWLFATMWIYHPILYVECLCSFLFGAIACKSSQDSLPMWFARMTDRSWKIAISLALLVIARCIINTDASSPLYTFLIILLLSRIHWAEWANKGLQFFGTHSTTMWLTHSYFCYYLFHDFIYGFKYPLLIFFVTVGCALFASYVVQAICRLCKLPR